MREVEYGPNAQTARTVAPNAMGLGTSLPGLKPDGQRVRHPTFQLASVRGRCELTVHLCVCCVFPVKQRIIFA